MLLVLIVAVRVVENIVIGYSCVVWSCCAGWMVPSTDAHLASDGARSGNCSVEASMAVLIGRIHPDV